MFRFVASLVVVQLIIAGTAVGAAAPATPAADASTSAVIYKVAANGKGEYPTIEAALAAAKDPAVDKIIQLEAGNYEFPMTKNTRLQLTTPRTHIKGAGPGATKIIASSGKGNNSWGVLEVRASHCTVDGVWVENRWKKGDIPGKQTALAVGTGEDPKVEPDSLTTVTGVRVTNSKFTATTKDRHSDHLAWDVVTIGGNVVDCEFDGCEMVGFADVFSTWAQRVDVKNCRIIAKGWNAIWVSGGSASLNLPQVAVSTFTNCKLASTHYYIAGGSSEFAPTVPVVYLKGCRPVNPDKSIPEAGRMLNSLALAVVIGDTPIAPFNSIKKGPEGYPPTVVIPDFLLKSNLDFLDAALGK